MLPVQYQDETYDVHFTALFSTRKDAVPIVCIHGWPGCFLEFLPIMDRLQSKYPDTLPYHFIALSIPGYTFSSGPPLAHDFTTLDAAKIFSQVLSDLGMTNYIVSAGDIGSRIARALAVTDSICAALHLNFCADSPMLSYPRLDL